jgi:hypothetical protein
MDRQAKVTDCNCIGGAATRNAGCVRLLPYSLFRLAAALSLPQRALEAELVTDSSRSRLCQTAALAGGRPSAPARR